jgi:predicted glycosyltransferase
MFDYEWAKLQHSVNCRLANRVLVPDAIPAERLARYGARGDKLVHYPGLKEDYVLHGFTPDEAVLDQLGVPRDKLLCVVRTAPAYALYLAGASDELVPRLLRMLAARDDVATVVLTRNAEQADQVRAISEQLLVPARAVDGRSLVAFADALVSAGGSMNREAAALGTPVWTMFEGRMGAVDERLIAEERLRVLHDVSDVELFRKPPFAAPFRGRDPAELLALALPWLG